MTPPSGPCRVHLVESAYLVAKKMSDAWTKCLTPLVDSRVCQNNTFLELSFRIFTYGVQMYWKHTDFFTEPNKRVLSQERGVEIGHFDEILKFQLTPISSISYSLFAEWKADF